MKTFFSLLFLLLLISSCGSNTKNTGQNNNYINNSDSEGYLSRDDEGTFLSTDDEVSWGVEIPQNLPQNKNPLNF